MRNFALVGAVALTVSAGVLMAAGSASAADPIVGTWKLSDGRSMSFSGSGSKYCGKAVGGKFAGKSLGCLKKDGSSYKGRMQDYTNDRKYTGTVKVAGRSMTLRGCVMGVLCRTVTASKR